MPQIAIEILSPFAVRFLGPTSSLTPSERAEVVRIAQGLACRDSASSADVSPETIRARRKRIYRKLDVSGASELLSSMLALSLRLLAAGEGVQPLPAPPSPARSPSAQRA